MKVILQEDVKNLGKVGDLVNVSNGYARNFLFPRKLASEATERRVNELEHLKKVASAKQKKAVQARKEVLAKLSNQTVSFKASTAENSDKIFGSITSSDISKELEKKGFSVDRKDIHLEESIRILGQHKAIVKFGEGLEAELKISVER